MRGIRLAAVLLLLALCTFGCAPREGDYFSAFSGAFSLDMTGELYGMPFSALLDVTPADGTGVREATLTFYAPSELCDTVVRYREGEIPELSVGGVCIQSETAEGFLALLALFPAAGSVREVCLEGEETLVVCEGVTLRFGADGTPLGAESAVARADVIRYLKK